jgi:hypothetical protein
MKRSLSLISAVTLVSCSSHGATAARQIHSAIDRRHGTLTWVRHDASSQLWTIVRDSSEGKFKITARCIAHIGNDGGVQRGPDACSHAVGDKVSSNIFVGPQKDGFLSIDIVKGKLVVSRVTGYDKYSDIYDVVSQETDLR